MRTRWLFGASILLGVGAIASCAEVLGISDPYPDVTTELCKCDLEPSLDVRWPGQTCEEHVSAALAADSEATSTWLALFESAGCQSCGAAETCARAAPICAELGEPCSFSPGCCGYDPENPSARYCGPTNPTLGVEGTCVSDRVDCAYSFEPCTEDSDCCGSAGNLGLCIQADQGGLCVTGCLANYDELCPGCCATIIPGSDEPFTACVSASEDRCASLCSTDCEPGASCVPTPLTPDGFVIVQACVPD